MLANGPSFRVLPRLDEDNRFFWTSGADGRLRFLRCQGCGHYVHPPGPVCPFCFERALEPEVVSGRGVLASYTINHHPWIPGSDHYAIAWVAFPDLDAIRLTTNLVDVEEDAIEIGMAVEVVFEPLDPGIYLPLFRPAREER